MPTYTVHQPPPRNGDTAIDPERFVFVRDGFYFWAFVLAPLWMLWHRLWLALVLYVVVFGAPRHCRFAGQRRRRRVQFLANLALIALLVGFEAASLRRWTLARRGWKNVGVVVGDDPEIRRAAFLCRVDRSARMSAPETARASPPTPPLQPVRRGPPSGNDVIGLFPEPGGAAMSVAIVDYGSGNLHSAAKAFERAARETGTTSRSWSPAIPMQSPAPTAWCCRASAPSPIAGAASTPCPAWSRRSNRTRAQAGKPFLGICVGMQLMAERGREYQVTPGLGWIAGEVDRIAPADPN